MNVYEFAFITQEDNKDLLVTLEKILAEFDIKVTQKDSWGERTFAYKIRNLTHGFYYLWTCTTEDPSKLASLKQRLNVEEPILRYLILKVD